MSLSGYDLLSEAELHGNNGIGLPASEFERQEMTYVTPNERYIIVRARVGGGNMDYHNDAYKQAMNNRHFSHFKQADSDGTYVDFYFNIPDAIHELAKTKGQQL